ncbi:MAG: 2-dehydropantoate 2-reductase N-terminal domain-containing protein [Acidimicrobiales bacterium]
MRIIVHGIGAVGGTVAATLTFAGHEVVGIARGDHLDAVRTSGLKMRTPGGDRVARFECVGSPSQIALRPDDHVVLAMKSQHTARALEQLAAAGLSDQPVFCAQNGVENERLTLRRFPNVHGITVILPADFVTPGEIVAYGVPRHGIFDIGRYPAGCDDADTALAEAATSAEIESFVQPDVMRSKYGKLLVNLTNIVEAALGPDADTRAVEQALRAEGESALTAAGIAWHDVGPADPRRKRLMEIHPVEGVERCGNSSTQSLTRSTGSIESDHLNGEIVLLGRLHDVPTPVNAWFTALAARMARQGSPPGSVTRGEVRDALGI